MTEKLPPEIKDAVESTVNEGVELNDLSLRFQAMVLGLSAFQKLKNEPTKPQDES